MNDENSIKLDHYATQELSDYKVVTYQAAQTEYHQYNRGAHAMIYSWKDGHCYILVTSLAFFYLVLETVSVIIEQIVCNKFHFTNFQFCKAEGCGVKSLKGVHGSHQNLANTARQQNMQPLHAGDLGIIKASNLK